MELITVATFDSVSPARALKDHLEHARLPSYLHDERRLQRFWFLSRPYAGIHVKVERDNLEKATSLLDRWDALDGALRQAVRCPECGSSRVEYPQMTRYFILPALVSQFLCFLRILSPEFYCKQCHHTWRRSRRSEDNHSRKAANQKTRSRTKAGHSRAHVLHGLSQSL